MDEHTVIGIDPVRHHHRVALVLPVVITILCGVLQGVRQLALFCSEPVRIALKAVMAGSLSVGFPSCRKWRRVAQLGR